MTTIEQFGEKYRVSIKQTYNGRAIYGKVGSIYAHPHNDSALVLFIAPVLWERYVNSLVRVGMKVLRNCYLTFDPTNLEQVSAAIKTAQIMEAA